MTVVTGGLLIKGPGEAADLTTLSRLVVTAFAVGGMAVAIWGLWHALGAAAGTPATQHYEGIREKYGSVVAFEVAQAKNAASDLRIARGSLAVALVLLGCAVVAWWWAEEEASSPPAFLEIEIPNGDTGAGETLCGALKSGDLGRLRIQVSGESRTRTFQLTEVTNVRVKAEC